MAKYPKIIYKLVERDGSDTFITYGDMSDVTHRGKTVEVAEYEFKRMVRIVNSTTVEPMKPAKKAAKKRRK